VGTCLIASAATLYQFWYRPYRHYALLALPLVIVAAMVASCDAWRRVHALARAPRRLVHAMVVVAAGLCVARPVPEGSLGLLGAPFTLRTAPHALDWRRYPGFAADLETLKSLVRPGEESYVLPPSLTAVYAVLGTTSGAPAGYTFAGGRTRCPEAVRAPSVGMVIMPRRPDVAAWVQDWLTLGCHEAAESLPDLGYQPVLVLENLIMWRRSSPAAEQKNTAVTQ
jgi:hypothetical protein